MRTASVERAPLSLARIVRTWWPLAASWMLMGLELPAVSAVVARLPEPQINLAAYGIVFAISMLIESPIIMLLAASTALSKDWDSYLKVRRFMMQTSALLTALHVLIAFTPLYYFVVVDLIGAPAQIIEPARWGLMLMTPWTWSIAYRRFHQGVLIRFGRSEIVGLGTVVRLSANLIVLGVGYLIGSIPGIIVAASAVSMGVMSEALFVGRRVRPCLQRLRQIPPDGDPLTLRAFLRFYIPLALTSLLTILVQPIGSAALSRMPGALESLAVWPVVSGLLFLLRSIGIAYNEVVVALLGKPRAEESLRRFATMLSLSLTAMLLLVTMTPLAELWFGGLSGLLPSLANLAQSSLWFALLLPAFSVWQSFYQGSLVYSRQTRGVTEAMALFLIVSSVILSVGVLWGQITGLYVAQIAFTIGGLAQMLWLAYRCRRAQGTL
ncbi:MAG: hypothetical protein NZ610_04780 [Candidatus Bipolaricaulota bacterium]|nr:hypothetical protein [Candidatus Bipolaricaulota bacterium]MCS7274705.1 hypothetical protein [Candidatus Bipolaricaulota bacterium]MDW8111588.1 hypothetical protein [Candidatus Bipolaricaulota bacterium]